MNKDDILSAAFRAWGREGYKKMSLSEVAAELGVTKPALYRHFRDKERILAAMRGAFFDRYVQRLRSVSPSFFAGSAWDPELLLKYVETIIRYFGGCRDDLAFLFGRVMNDTDPEAVFKQAFAERGVDVPALLAGTDLEIMRVGNAVSTGFFLVALFHLARKDHPLPPTDTELGELTESALSLCSRGLGFPPDACRAVDYRKLERMASPNEAETAAPDGLLPAVAAVVAEVGSWHASMDMVAKKSGLSKSGLYAHFKSKEDMLARLFVTEFERLSLLLADRVSRSADLADQLYLAQAATAEYLLARPDVLVALDWARKQRIGIGEGTPRVLEGAFAFLNEAAEAGKIKLLPGGSGTTLRWILFLTVHQLVHKENGEPPRDFPARRLRSLHSFILSGLGAAGYDEKSAL